MFHKKKLKQSKGNFIQLYIVKVLIQLFLQVFTLIINLLLHFDITSKLLISKNVKWKILAFFSLVLILFVICFYLLCIWKKSSVIC